MKMIKRVCDRKTMFFLVGFLLSLGMLIWKLPYSVNTWDESFCLSLGHRLAKGDSLFAHEWHVTQMSGLFQLPFMKLFFALNETTDGMVLYFRWIYLIFHACWSILLYCQMKRYCGAGVAACFYLLYVPIMLMVPTYLSVSFGSIVLLELLFAKAETFSYPRYICIGVLFTFALVACPHVAILYVLYTVMVFGKLVLKYVEKTEVSVNFSLKTWLVITLAMGVVGLIFLAIILKGSSLGEVIRNIKIMLGHARNEYTMTFSEKFEDYGRVLKDVYGRHLYLWIGVLVAIVHDKKRVAHRIFYLVLTLGLVAWVELELILKEAINNTNRIIFPVVFVGAVAFGLIENKAKYKPIFGWGYTIGGIFTFCRHWSSMNRIDAIAPAAIVVGVPAMLLVMGLVEEIRSDRKKTVSTFIQKCACYGSAGCVLFAVIFMLFDHAPAMPKLIGGDTEVLQDGPYAGVIVPKGHSYTRCLNDVKSIGIDRNKKGLFATKNPWYYLWADMEYATPSSWADYYTMNYIDITMEYYELHPEKIPDFVYVEKGAEWDDEHFLMELSGMWDLELTETPRGRVLMKSTY